MVVKQGAAPAVASAAQVGSDIAAIDAASQQDTGTGTVFRISLQNGATLTETASLSVVDITGDDRLVIEGNGPTLGSADPIRSFEPLDELPHALAMSHRQVPPEVRARMAARAAALAAGRSVAA